MRAGIKKHACPCKKLQGQAYEHTNLRYHLDCRKTATSTKMRTHFLPCNASTRQKILGKKPFTLPSAVHLPVPLFASFPATEALCGCAYGVISASSVLIIKHLFQPFVKPDFDFSLNKPRVPLRTGCRQKRQSPL